MVTIITIILSVVAILISLGSLCLGFLNRRDQRTALLLAKKTELATRLIETDGKFRHLAMIYAQKILFLRQNTEISDSQEINRAKSNMEIAEQKSEDMMKEHASLQANNDLSLKYIETRLAEVRSFLAHSSSELTKEQEVFGELKVSSRQI